MLNQFIHKRHHDEQDGENLNPKKLKNLTPQQMFFRAVKRNDRHLVNDLLHQGVHINVQNEQRATALILAAQRGYWEMVQDLLTYPGVATELADNEGMTALHYAAQISHFPIVQALLNAGANPNARANAMHNAASVLMVAGNVGEGLARQFRLTKTQQLGLQHAQAHRQNHAPNENYTFAVVQLLIQRGAQVNALNNQLETPLRVALGWRNIPKMRALLAHGGRVNPIEPSLFTAVRHNIHDIAPLLEAGADPNETNAQHQSLWQFAGQFQNRQLILAALPQPPMLQLAPLQPIQVVINNPAVVAPGRVRPRMCD